MDEANVLNRISPSLEFYTLKPVICDTHVTLVGIPRIQVRFAVKMGRKSSNKVTHSFT